MYLLLVLVCVACACVCVLLVICVSHNVCIHLNVHVNVHARHVVLARTSGPDALDPVRMEVASLPCKRRRISNKAPAPPARRVLVSRNDDSDSDESVNSNPVIMKMIIRKKSRVRSECMGIAHDTYTKMKGCQLPWALFNLIWWLANVAKASCEQNIDHIEWFAGVGNVHRAMLQLGLDSVAVDVKYDNVLQNYIHKKGMLYGVQLQRRLRRRGGQHKATVCSSWIWANRATSKRYESLPLGVQPWSESVAAANQMVSMSAMLWLWAWCAGVYTILEQPLGSLMGSHPRVCQIKRAIPSFKHFTTHMGAFGGPTPKPTNLYTDAPYAHKLVRSPTLSDKARFALEAKEIMTRDAITGSLTGGKDMKESQAYPEGYGIEVAAAYKDHVDNVAEELFDSESSSDEESLVQKDQWLDSGLHKTCEWLQLPIDAMAM